jgi:hypothetical protein
MSDNVIQFPGSRTAGAGETPSASSFTMLIQLVDAEPAIWRRVQLPSDLRLDRVHQVVQRVMGWTDVHLHEFVLPSDGSRFVMEDDEGDLPGTAEASVRLDQLLRLTGDRLLYEYDFGDGWTHTLTLEEITSYDPTGSPALCLGGERACPPEDVGGIHHYNTVAAWLASRDPSALVDDPHLSETVEWLPWDFDARRFDVGETNRILTLTLGPPPPDVPNPAVGSLAAHLDESGRRYLGELVMLADLRAAPPSDDDVTVAMGPYLILLDVVGADGMPLTSAGYLPPAETQRVLAAIGYDKVWPGLGSRETSTPPVRQLRESAQALGLVRRASGRLVRTPAGRATAGDAAGLWAHITSRLPLGRGGHEQDAGAIALLCSACGPKGREVFDQYAETLLDLAGWTYDDGERVAFERVVFEWARPTWRVLWTVDPPTSGLSRQGPLAAHLARAALLSRTRD